nr:2-hydroxymuconate tautomerase [Paenisporosarcina sp. TG-14]
MVNPSFCFGFSSFAIRYQPPFCYYNQYTNFCERGGTQMPYVTVKMLEGRTDDQKRALVEKVTAAVVETTNAPIENVVVFIEDMPKNHYAVAGKLFSDN